MAIEDNLMGWCCLYHSMKNRLIALLEALFALFYADLRYGWRSQRPEPHCRHDSESDSSNEAQTSCCRQTSMITQPRCHQFEARRLNLMESRASMRENQMITMWKTPASLVDSPGAEEEGKGQSFYISFFQWGRVPNLVTCRTFMHSFFFVLFTVAIFFMNAVYKERVHT